MAGHVDALAHRLADPSLEHPLSAGTDPIPRQPRRQNQQHGSRRRRRPAEATEHLPAAREAPAQQDRQAQPGQRGQRRPGQQRKPEASRCPEEMPALAGLNEADRLMRERHDEEREQRFRRAAENEVVHLRMEDEQPRGQRAHPTTEQARGHPEQKNPGPDGKRGLQNHRDPRISRSRRNTDQREQRRIERQAQRRRFAALQRIHAGFHPVRGQDVIAVVVGPRPLGHLRGQEWIGRDHGDARRHQERHQNQGHPDGTSDLRWSRDRHGRSQSSSTSGKLGSASTAGGLPRPARARKPAAAATMAALSVQ